MIKVLHLISGGDSGGAKTHIFSLMKGFENKVYAKIICFMDGDFYQEAKDLGINIEVLEQRSRFDMKPMKEIIHEINSQGYDLVHCHGARANFNALFIRKSISVPMITTLHSDYLLDFKDSFIKNKVFTPLNVYALKKFPFYIAITKRFCNMLIERGFQEENIFVAYNGIDMEKQEKKVSKEEFLSRYNLLSIKDKLLFVFAARLDLVKDHMTLLKAIHLYKDKLSQCHFLLAGTGAEGDKLKQYVMDNGIEDLVSFLGQVSDPFSLFEAGDINMLTSQSESFPYALLEGAKEKLPFIATDVGGISEMAGPNGAVLFQPNDAVALGKILVDFAENPEKRFEMGQSLYGHVKNNFSNEVMALNHEKIYKEVLERTGGQNANYR